MSVVRSGRRWHSWDCRMAVTSRATARERGHHVRSWFRSHHRRRVMVSLLEHAAPRRQPRHTEQCRQRGSVGVLAARQVKRGQGPENAVRSVVVGVACMDTADRMRRRRRR
jgi:hypothetical protein